MVTKKPRHPVALPAQCCAGTPSQRLGEVLRTSQRQAWLSQFLGIARRGLGVAQKSTDSRSEELPLEGGLVQLARQQRGMLP